MPEGTEIKVIAQDLNIFNGQELININNISDKFKNNPVEIPQQYEHPNVVDEIITHGKNLYIKIGSYYIHIHLMLRGQLSLVKPKKPALVIEFSNNTLYLSDSMKLAVVNILTAEEYIKQIESMGDDVLNLTAERFKQILDKRYRSKINTMLVNQKIIAGIGLYLRSEILYYARICPFRLVSSLTEEERNTLYNSIMYIYQTVIEHGGSKKYTRVSGEKGTYEMLIYKKDMVDGYEVHNKNSVYYVPELQT